MNLRSLNPQRTTTQQLKLSTDSVPSHACFPFARIDFSSGKSVESGGRIRAKPRGHVSGT
jgi:hypothetical protein